MLLAPSGAACEKTTDAQAFSNANRTTPSLQRHSATMHCFCPKRLSHGGKTNFILPFAKI
eukprot:6457872-Amphidinium_carterae.1